MNALPTEQLTTRAHSAAAEKSVPSVVQVRDLTMSYGRQQVLRGVDFDIQTGDLVALLGPNGAGKTTIIEILEGFRERSGGQVSVLGVDPARAGDAWRARIGVVLQSWRDHARWQVRDVLRYAAAHYRGYSSASTTRPRDPDELLAAVGLTEASTQTMGSLSGGQRRRVDVALGIVGNPDLLFLDEPTTGFDPEARREFHTLIRSLGRDYGTTILLTTHDLAEAEALAGSIMILDQGLIQATGTSTELTRQVAGTTVTWTEDGESRSATVDDSTQFIRGLLADTSRTISDVHFARVSLEDAYLSFIGASTPA